MSGDVFRVAFLHAAAAAGDAEEVAQLLAAVASVDVRNAQGDTPLATAALAGQFAMVQQLLMAGADVTAALVRLRYTVQHNVVTSVFCSTY